MGIEMVKIDLSKVNYTGKEQKEQEVDDPLAVQRMRLEEAKWRALGGAGGGPVDPPRQTRRQAPAPHRAALLSGGE